MPVKLKSAKFTNNTLKKNGTTVTHLEPTDDGDDFEQTFCVKVVDKRDTTRYWGGRLKMIASGRVWKAHLKFQSDSCTEHALDADQDDQGKPRDTTDVSVTIENPSTGDKNTIDVRNVTVLP